MGTSPARGNLRVIAGGETFQQRVKATGVQEAADALHAALPAWERKGAKRRAAALGYGLEIAGRIRKAFDALEGMSDLWPGPKPPIDIRPEAIKGLFTAEEAAAFKAESEGLKLAMMGAQATKEALDGKDGVIRRAAHDAAPAVMGKLVGQIRSAVRTFVVNAPAFERRIGPLPGTGLIIELPPAVREAVLKALKALTAALRKLRTYMLVGVSIIVLLVGLVVARELGLFGRK